MSHDASPVPAPPARVGDRVVDALAGPATGLLTGLGSALRRARLFHPSGRVFHATVRVTGDRRFAGTVLGGPAEHHAIVRFSRGTGFAEPLPDMLGMAVRLFGADGGPADPDRDEGRQDVLLLSSLPAVGARHVIAFRPGYGSTFYSSIGRLRLAEQTVVLGARAEFTGPPEPLPRLAELAAARDRVTFAFTTASLTGDWTEPVATMTLGDEVPPERTEGLRFTPFHRAGGIEPVGAVNTLRRLGYAGSQLGRPH